MEPQKHEMNEKRLIRWLLIATLALLVLVLGLQAWRMLSPPVEHLQAADAQADFQGASEPLNAPAANVSPYKTAKIEDIRALNPALALDDLAALGTEELDQLLAAGAPGLPIGTSLAAHVAEEYAGTLEADSVTCDVDPELGEAPAHYEVELHHITLGDFEYKIDAYTGEVLEGVPDILQSTGAPAAGKEVPASANTPQPEAPAPKVSAPAAPAAQQPAPSGGQPALIGEAAAKSAAFTHAGVQEANVDQVRCKLDWEDGIQVYEIEFRSGGMKYDYEVNATTGAALKAEWEQDARPGTAAQQPAAGAQPALIGEAAAKSAAFTHAGVREADAARVKCKLDWEDGVQIYEVEFDAGLLEYDYEIDAATGAVLKAEQERAD